MKDSVKTLVLLALVIFGFKVKGQEQSMIGDFNNLTEYQTWYEKITKELYNGNQIEAEPGFQFSLYETMVNQSIQEQYNQGNIPNNFAGQIVIPGTSISADLNVTLIVPEVEFHEGNSEAHFAFVANLKPLNGVALPTGLKSEYYFPMSKTLDYDIDETVFTPLGFIENVSALTNIISTGNTGIDNIIKNRIESYWDRISFNFLKEQMASVANSEFFREKPIMIRDPFFTVTANSHEGHLTVGIHTALISTAPRINVKIRKSGSQFKFTAQSNFEAEILEVRLTPAFFPDGHHEDIYHAKTGLGRIAKNGSKNFFFSKPSNSGIYDVLMIVKTQNTFYRVKAIITDDRDWLEITADLAIDIGEDALEQVKNHYDDIKDLTTELGGTIYASVTDLADDTEDYLGDLKDFALKGKGNPIESTVDYVGDVGKNILDTTGNVIVASYDYTARQTGKAWNFVTGWF